MTRTAQSSKLLLIADRRAGSPAVAGAVRRYRLARLRLDAKPVGVSIRTQPAGRALPRICPRGQAEARAALRFTYEN